MFFIRCDRSKLLWRKSFFPEMKMLNSLKNSRGNNSKDTYNWVKERVSHEIKFYCFNSHDQVYLPQANKSCFCILAWNLLAFFVISISTEHWPSRKKKYCNMMHEADIYLNVWFQSWSRRNHRHRWEAQDSCHDVWTEKVMFILCV